MTLVRLSIATLAAATALCATGCGPRVVTDITLSPNFAKVTYAKRSFFAPETGVIECDRALDGSLSNCRKMTVNLRKPAQ